MSSSLLKYVVAGGLIGLALYLRWDIAPRVFPAQTDASHFIEYGTRMAQTDWRAIDGYWSFGPQFLVMAAHRAGWSAHFTLQRSTIIFGVLVVASGMGFTWLISGSFALAALFGLLAAANPALIHASLSGLSEMPAIAFFLTGASLVLWGWKRGGMWEPTAGAAIAALALYYRPYELMVTLALFLLTAVIVMGKTWRRPDGVRVVVMLTAFFIVAAPSLYISQMTRSTETRDVKLVNIAFGELGYDSKVINRMYLATEESNPLTDEFEALAEKGAFQYILSRRDRIVRNYVVNIGRGLRQMSSHIFPGSVHVGTAWFVLINLALFLALLLRPGRRVFLSALFLPYALISLYSLSFVHPRWTMQGVPYLLMALAAGAWTLSSLGPSNRWFRGFVAVVLVVFAQASISRAYEQGEDQWRGLNLFDVAERLREHAAEEDRIMTFGAALGPLFYQTNFHHQVRLPYGSIEEIEQTAEARRVAFIVVNDASNPHYPIQEVFKGAPLPDNWTVLDVYTYDRYTRFGEESNRYMVIQRAQRHLDQVHPLLLPGLGGSDDGLEGAGEIR